MNFTKRQLEEIVEKQRRMMTNDRTFYLERIKKLEEENKHINDLLNQGLKDNEELQEENRKLRYENNALTDYYVRTKSERE